MIRLETSIISKFKKGDLEVVIEMALPGKTTRRIFRLGHGYEDRFPVNDPAEYLVITPPAGEDFQLCTIRVQAQVDVIVECLVEEGKWRIRFPHGNAGGVNSSSGANSPATVNITVAPPEENTL